MSIKYNVLDGYPPVRVDLIQGGIVIDSNIHIVVPDSGQFDNVLYGAYTLYFEDVYGCNDSYDITTTTTTTKEPCVFPENYIVPGILIKSIDVEGQWDFTGSWDDACVAFGLYEDSGETLDNTSYNAISKRWGFNDYWRIGDSVYNTDTCELIPTGYYISKIDGYVVWQIIYIVDGIIVSYPVCLGFEPYVAPDNFDRKAQPVDIYEMFERYYRNHGTAKYIYSLNNTITTYTFNTYGGQNYVWPICKSYRYGYRSGGVDYVNNIGAYTTVNGTYSPGTYNRIPANDVSDFPTSGTIKIKGGSEFIYTSLDNTPGDNAFIGNDQSVTGLDDGYSIDLLVTVDWTGKTNRWIIGIGTISGSSGLISLNNNIGPEWIYAGNNINSIVSTGTTKYIHIHKLDNISEYDYMGHLNNISLTGTLYLSRNPSLTISSYAFQNCTGLTSVTIPSNWTSIGIAMFRYCNGLINVTFESTSSLLTINEYAFFGDTGLTGTLTIPDSVTSIGNYAFQSCNKFSGLTLSSSLQDIGIAAFNGNSSMVGTLTIPNTVTSIGYIAFNATKFTSAVSNSSSFYDDDDVLYDITVVGEVKAIYGAGGKIASLTLRSDTTKIDGYSFFSNLRTGTLTIPNTVTNIYEWAFYYTKFTGTLTIPASIRTIGNQSFTGNIGFTDLVLEEGVTSIGFFAFGNFNGMSGKSLTVPNSVITIEGSAFQQQLSTVFTGTLTIGSSVQTIGIQAFYSCAFTGTLTIPSSVISIGDGAFAYNKVTSIISSASGFTVSDYVLYDETVGGSVKVHTGAGGYGGSLTLKNDSTVIMTCCFIDNTGRTANPLVIPATIIEIKGHGLRGCSGISGDLTLPSALVTFGGSALSNMTGLWDSIIIGATNPTFADNYPFWGCSNIGRTSGGVQLPANYSSDYNDWNFSDYLSADTMNQSLLNITDGTSTNWKTFTIGATNKARLLDPITGYPNAESDANVRYIYVV